MRVDMGKCQNILRLKNHSSFRCAFSLMLRYVIYVFFFPDRENVTISFENKKNVTDAPKIKCHGILRNSRTNVMKSFEIQENFMES